MIGPYAIINAVVEALGGNYEAQYGIFTVDCEATYGVTFTIGGRDYEVAPKQLVVDLGDGLCEMTFNTMDGAAHGPEWILGDPFIRQYCQIYDIGQKRIGFARPLRS